MYLQETNNAATGVAGNKENYILKLYIEESENF